MATLTGYERRRVQAGATTSHLSLAATSARKGTPLSLTVELADGTRLELELSGVEAVSQMAKQDDDARQRDEAEVVVDVALPSDDDAAEVAQPGEEALDLP